MHDINRVTLVGRLTRDCELRTLPSGSSVCDLRVAFTSRHREGPDGDFAERSNYVSVTVFGPHGETVARYMSRGRKVGIDGRLRWSEWESEGQKRQSIDIVADTVQFLEPPTEGGAERPLDDGDLVGAVVGEGEEEIAF